MVSVMFYPCSLCVALLVYLFVLCVACLTLFVNCLVKQFAMCLGVVAILLLNVMEVFSSFFISPFSDLLVFSIIVRLFFMNDKNKKNKDSLFWHNNKYIHILTK